MTKYCNGSLVGFVTHLLVAERLQAVTSKKLLVKIQNPFVAFFCLQIHFFCAALMRKKYKNG